MTAVLLGHWEPGTPEWHAARAQGLGGSEIAAVLGLSPFESRFSLWHRKAGAVGPVEETPEMYWGKALEPVIKGEFTRVSPIDWDLVETGTWCHPDRPWQLGNPDSLLFHHFGDGKDHPHSLLETKLSMFGDGWGDDGTDEVPPHVRCQCIWYGDVFGLTSAEVCVLIAVGLEVRRYTLTWDEAEAVQLREAGRAFLDDVAAGRRPDIDDHTATYQTVKELHPDIDGSEVELSNVVAKAFIEAKAFQRRADDHARQATAAVADEMGDAQRAVWDGDVIARRQARGGGLPYVVAARCLGDHLDLPLAGVAAGSQPHEGEAPF